MAAIHMPTAALSADHLAGALARLARRTADLLDRCEVRLAVRRLERVERRTARDPASPTLGQLGVAARTGRTGHPVPRPDRRV